MESISQRDFSFFTKLLVYEGHVLRRGIVNSPLGSNFVQQRMGELLTSEKGKILTYDYHF